LLDSFKVPIPIGEVAFN